MLLDIFTSVISGYLALVLIWIVTLLIVLLRLFRRKDILLPAKLFWAVIILVAPLIGLILYLIAGLPKRKKLLESTEKAP